MKNFVFTITAGRNGTVYLTELLKQNPVNAEVYPERFGYQNFGVETPDASHVMLFNSVGNVPQVQNFWKQKLTRNGQVSSDWYVEISHVLSKAGLIENLHYLGEVHVHIVILKRAAEKTAWSFYNRLDFFNHGFAWLFTLDPRYPNKPVTFADLIQAGMMGAAIWYVFEMAARAEYYKLLVADVPNIQIHEVDLEDITDAEGAAVLLTDLGAGVNDPLQLPAPQNESKSWVFPESDRDNSAACWFRSPSIRLLSPPITSTKENAWSTGPGKTTG